MPGSTRSYEFSKRMVKDGHKVYVLTSDWQNKLPNLNFEISGVKVYASKIPYSNKMGFMTRIFVFIRFIFFILFKARKLKFDIIYASSTPLTVAIPALLLKKIRKAKLIFEIRDIWPELPIAMKALNSKFLIYLAEKLEIITYNNSEKIVALSSGMKKALDSKINASKICVVTNLCHNESFNVPELKGQEFRKKYSIPLNSPMIVYSGAFGKINNAAYLIEISKHFLDINPNVKFLLAGNGFQRTEIVQKAKKYNVYGENTIIIDYVPKKMMPSLLSASTIASSLFINLKEMENNSANKFFDALAAGKPIMLNYEGWQYDLLKKQNAGFKIPSNDANKAALLINDVVNNQDRIKKMGISARYLSKKFDVNRNYLKIRDILTNI